MTVVCMSNGSAPLRGPHSSITDDHGRLSSVPRWGAASDEVSQTPLREFPSLVATEQRERPLA
ncbi:hypothetical protein A5789_05945 [Nocardia sp. 852002-51101_SCH5132738]|nr:hypothetical protein A5789_05945 [Nocardia sp. 852002-51101_SCH5132738]OBB38607.1 hypothetical protein A5748_02850 [Nocardia sp. 852002-51244_SCH5132740]OBF82917.1 hypothetical protein A9X06_18275 [Mycobacterium sp. 852002-51759_SCH5129042]